MQEVTGTGTGRLWQPGQVMRWDAMDGQLAQDQLKKWNHERVVCASLVTPTPVTFTSAVFAVFAFGRNLADLDGPQPGGLEGPLNARNMRHDGPSWVDCPRTRALLGMI